MVVGVGVVVVVVVDLFNHPLVCRTGTRVYASNECVRGELTARLFLLLPQPADNPGLQQPALVSLAIQVGVFVIHGYPRSSEKYYDASGSLTHFAVVLMSLMRDEGRSKRQILLGVCSVIWMTRLGSFLFTRIMKDGKDGRFDALKKNILRFLAAWSIQALWVFLIQLPVLIVNSQALDNGGE